MRITLCTWFTSTATTGVALAAQYRRTGAVRFDLVNPAAAMGN
ncbi:MAG: hypothetical protein V9H26_00695 [Verrucomicrobiota bacterium]